MRRTILIALLVAASPVCADQTTLGYDAFVAGTKVGAAEVNIQTNDSRYTISGKAWSVGVMNFVTQWQGKFSSQGRLGNEGPVNEAYRFVEQARDKVKELVLADGHLTYVKNGEKRSPRAPTSLDLLSALFLSGDCAAAGSQVHNGKDPFSLKLTHRESLTGSKSGATERCTFEVQNKDHERIDATVWVGQIDGLTVPVRLDLAGALEGTLKLHSPGSAGLAASSDQSDPDPTLQI